MRTCAEKVQLPSECRISHSSQSTYFDAVALPVSSVRYDLLFGDVDLNRRQGAPLDDRQRLDGGKITTHGPVEVFLTVVVVFQGPFRT